MKGYFLTGIILISVITGCRQLTDIMKKSESEILLMKKRILVGESEILFSRESFTPGDLALFNFHQSEWNIVNGWLEGKNHDNHPGMAILKQEFKGNVLVEFEAQTITPSTHDINVMWNGEWVDSLDRRGTAYVAGLEGWWSGKVGIEKSPEYTFMLGTPLFDFEPGKTYKIQAGSIDGHCFILADGILLLEGMDPEPIDHQSYDKVGFEAYSSHIRIRKVIIRRIKWEPVDMYYDPEF
jgi:hypothetical protein